MPLSKIGFWSPQQALGRAASTIPGPPRSQATQERDPHSKSRVQAPPTQQNEDSPYPSHLQDLQLPHRTLVFGALLIFVLSDHYREEDCPKHILPCPLVKTSKPKMRPIRPQPTLLPLFLCSHSSEPQGFRLDLNFEHGSHHAVFATEGTHTKTNLFRSCAPSFHAFMPPKIIPHSRAPERL